MLATLNKRRPVVYLLACAAALNMCLGLFLALTESRRAGDLLTVTEWCRTWLFQTGHLYRSDSPPDYPPNAIVTYAPLLTAIPPHWLVACWAGLILILTFLLPYGVLRWATPRARVTAAVVPTLLFLAWGGVRTLLQFSRFSFLLAVVSLWPTTPVLVAGCCLGVALAKPHIAGPLALWAACTRRIGMVAVAIGVVASEYVVYCWRVGILSLAPIQGWFRALRETYSGALGLNGYTSIRAWVVRLSVDRATADLIWIGTAAAVLMALCAAAWRDRTRTLAMPSLLCLWSLLAIYHNLNNVAILVLPAFIFLLTVDDPATDRLRFWSAVILQAGLVLDVTVRFRDVARGPFALVVRDAERILVLTTFVVVGWLWLRLQRTALRSQPL